MPKYINIKQMHKLFPFEFYKELTEAMKEYTFTRPSFLLQQPNIDETHQKKLFASENENINEYQGLHQNNIIDTDAFGELLLLDLVCEKQKVSDMLDANKKHSVFLSILCVQYYDNQHVPVFTKKTPAYRIETMSEVLWDDPNLLIAVITFTDTGVQIAGLKVPAYIESKAIEPK